MHVKTILTHFDPISRTITALQYDADAIMFTFILRRVKLSQRDNTIQRARITDIHSRYLAFRTFRNLTRG